MSHATICADCGDQIALADCAWRKRRTRLPQAICYECKRFALDAAREMLARELEEAAKHIDRPRVMHGWMEAVRHLREGSGD